MPPAASAVQIERSLSIKVHYIVVQVHGDCHRKQVPVSTLQSTMMLQVDAGSRCQMQSRNSNLELLELP